MSGYAYRISTSTVHDHDTTEAEAEYLGQVLAIDGEDAVIISREDIRNGSGRVCGEHLTVTDDAWECVQSAIADAVKQF